MIEHVVVAKLPKDELVIFAEVTGISFTHLSTLRARASVLVVSLTPCIVCYDRGDHKNAVFFHLILLGVLFSIVAACC